MSSLFKKKPDVNALAQSIADSADELNERDTLSREHRKQELDSNKAILLVPLKSIKPRLHGDLRAVDIGHALSLARSIAQNSRHGVFGLIQSLAVDQELRLLCGRHRQFACELISQPQGTRHAWILSQIEAGATTGLASHELLKPDPQSGIMPVEEIPYFVGEVPAICIHCENDLDRSLAIEVIENEKRKDFTREDIKRLIDRLENMGYAFISKAGNRSEEERSGVPLLAHWLGKSHRQAQRLVTKAKLEEPLKPEKQFKNHENALKRILKDQDLPDDLKALAKKALQILKNYKVPSQEA